MGYRIINGKAYPVGNFGNIAPKQNVENKNKEVSFKNVLDKAIDSKKGFTVSKHAAERINEINFNEQDMKNIEKGFKLAEGKGAKNTLMLYKDVALITSIENKTIITAIGKERSKENIFTNIDSVIML